MTLLRVRKTLLISLPILLIFVILGAVVFLLKNANTIGNSGQGLLVVFLVIGVTWFIFICLVMACIASDNNGGCGYCRNERRCYHKEDDPFEGSESGTWYYWWW